MIIGTIGYLIAGEMLSNAMYAAFSLYSGSASSDAYNVYIEIARWTAPLVTATAIVCALKNVWNAVKDRIKLLWKSDSVAVYSDQDERISFGKDASVIYPGETFKKYAQEHIIVFSTDQKSLHFYEKHRDALADKKTYIGVKDIECCFLESLGNVNVFDINGAVARMLWKEIALWKKAKTEADIVIWGDDALFETIISTGLQMNLFSRSQRIRYHIITNNSLFRARHSELKLMNNDELCYYQEDDPAVWDVIAKSDIIIVSDVSDTEIMQTIVVKAGTSEVYYYSPEEGNVFSHFSYGNIVPFGRNTDVLTDKNIRRSGTVKKAVKLHENYAKQYGTEQKWDQLSGFLKGSNISASDFGEVLYALHGSISEEEQAELEHIRWCRFMFLNYYTYGIPENSKNRDDSRRIHRDLVRFAELGSGEKQKNVEAVRIVRRLYEQNSTGTSGS